LGSEFSFNRVLTLARLAGARGRPPRRTRATCNGWSARLSCELGVNDRSSRCPAVRRPPLSVAGPSHARPATVRCTSRRPSVRPPQARLSSSSVRSRTAPSVTIRCSARRTISLCTGGMRRSLTFSASRPSSRPGGPSSSRSCGAPAASSARPGSAAQLIRARVYRRMRSPPSTSRSVTTTGPFLAPLPTRSLERTHRRPQPAG
jgi:hypothetical protein